MEKRFSLQLDPLFEYYLYCAGLIGLSITLIKYCMPKMELPLPLVYSLFSSLGVIVLSVVIVHYKQKLHLVFRLLIWLVVSGFLICCATIDIISVSADCGDHNHDCKSPLVIHQFEIPIRTFSLSYQLHTVSIRFRTNAMCPI